MNRFLSSRRVRSIKVTSERWQGRAVFVLGGIVIGAVAVALAMLADWAQLAFAALIAKSRYASLLVTPAGFALSVFLTNRFFPNSQGSGIPQAIAARQLSDQAARGRLVSLRIAVGKVFLTLLGLFCGASAGREGPTVQVGASIMFALGRMSPRRQHGEQPEQRVWPIVRHPALQRRFLRPHDLAKSTILGNPWGRSGEFLLKEISDGVGRTSAAGW
jgi:H+/Cl- antiporter ClcA